MAAEVIRGFNQNVECCMGISCLGVSLTPPLVLFSLKEYKKPLLQMKQHVAATGLL